MNSTTLDYTLPPDVDALRREAESFARTAEVRRCDDSWLVGFDRELTEALGRRGWIGMTWPRELGGQGRSALERFVVYEALIANGMPISAGYFADRQIGPTLLQFGSPSQCRRWLPGMASGCSMWCIGLSEPDAGSDLASIGTRAVLDGDWRVSGRKVWTSGALHADWMYLVARTGERRDGGGLSELVVDMRSPGIEVRPIRDMTGNEHFCEVTFDDVRVPADHLVGTLHGSFRQVMKQLEHERGGIDRVLSNYALFRDVLDAGVVDRTHPLIRQELAVIDTSYRLVRFLVLRSTVGQAPAGSSAVTKLLGTELEQRVARFCAMALGPAALASSDLLALRVARNLAYAQGYTIMGGTSNVLRNVLAERVLGLPR